MQMQPPKRVKEKEGGGAFCGGAVHLFSAACMHECIVTALPNAPPQHHDNICISVCLSGMCVSWRLFLYPFRVNLKKRMCSLPYYNLQHGHSSPYRSLLSFGPGSISCAVFVPFPVSSLTISLAVSGLVPSPRRSNSFPFFHSPIHY